MLGKKNFESSSVSLLLIASPSPIMNLSINKTVENLNFDR